MQGAALNKRVETTNSQLGSSVVPRPKSNTELWAVMYLYEEFSRSPWVAEVKRKIEPEVQKFRQEERARAIKNDDGGSKTLRLIANKFS